MVVLTTLQSVDTDMDERKDDRPIIAPECGMEETREEKEEGWTLTSTQQEASSYLTGL